MRREELNSEMEMASGIQAGDRCAFRRAFDYYSPKLYNYSYNFLKSREHAEEVVQEVFLSLWLNRERLEIQYSLAPLLYTMTRRMTLNALRGIARSNHAMEELWSRLRQESNETEETIITDDLRSFTNRILETLPKQQQLVFRMSRERELSYDEIAESLNISKNTVRNHLVSALKTIRVQVGRVLFFL